MFGLGAIFVGLGFGGIVTHFYYTKKYHLITKEDANSIIKALEKQINIKK